MPKRKKRPTRAEKIRDAHAVKDQQRAESLLYFDSPESSTIAGASYDNAAQELAVRFKQDGEHPPRVYTYAGVDVITWAQFLAAKSKGKFFSASIRTTFEGKLRG